MSQPVNVRKIGNSLGVILPKAELEAMGVKEGDGLYIIRSPDGLKLTPYDPKFEKAMELARDYMREHRDAFKELAK